MAFILEDRMSDGRPNGWYAGRNKKYHDMFDLTADKKFAKKFDDREDAEKIAQGLNKNGWNFTILDIVCEQCKKCQNYQICDEGCNGNTQPCDKLIPYEDERTEPGPNYWGEY